MSASPIHVGFVSGTGTFKHLRSLVPSSVPTRIPANQWVRDAESGKILRIMQSRTYTYFELRVLFTGDDE